MKNQEMCINENLIKETEVKNSNNLYNISNLVFIWFVYMHKY